MAGRRDDVVALVFGLGIVAGTVALANLLPAHRSPGPPSTPSSFNGEPTCAEWTDGCIICQRGERGPVCSMPGIACVPRERQCVRRDGV